jgi:hypothetical protein
MANQVRPWLIEPKTSAALRVRKSEWEPASKSHQGQRHTPQRKSGCTGAIYPCKLSELKAWQGWGRPCTELQRKDLPARMPPFPEWVHACDSRRQLRRLLTVDRRDLGKPSLLEWKYLWFIAMPVDRHGRQLDSSVKQVKWKRGSPMSISLIDPHKKVIHISVAV